MPNPSPILSPETISTLEQLLHNGPLQPLLDRKPSLKIIKLPDTTWYNKRSCLDRFICTHDLVGNTVFDARPRADPVNTKDQYHYGMVVVFEGVNSWSNQYAEISEHMRKVRRFIKDGHGYGVIRGPVYALIRFDHQTKMPVTE